MARLNTFYCQPLSSEQQAQLRTFVTTYRASLLNDQLAAVQELTEELGDAGNELQKFFVEILTMGQEAPERFAELVSHWAPSFLLGRLLERSSDADRQKRMLGTLVGLLICQRLDPRYAAAFPDATFVTGGELVGLLRNARLRLDGVNGHSDRLEWKFSGDALEVRSDDGTVVRTSLPIGEDSAITFEPLPRSRSWGLPVLENVEEIGMAQFQPSPEDPRYAGIEDGQLPSFIDTLEGAHRLLEDLWPEVLPWAEILVPAFADMGGPPSQWVHRSATYGGNSPIFLSKADGFLAHAQDIVHELQHLRLFLLLGAADFASWDDLRQRFISPYRKDPRPLRGLILGIHAFVAVNEIRLRTARRDGSSEDQAFAMLKTHRMNLFSFRTLLEHEELGPGGRQLMAEIASELAKHHQPIEQAANAKMTEEFDRRLNEHRAAVRDYALEHGFGEVLNGGDEYVEWDETARLAAEADFDGPTSS